MALDYSWAIFRKASWKLAALLQTVVLGRKLLFFDWGSSEARLGPRAQSLPCWFGLGKMHMSNVVCTSPGSWQTAFPPKGLWCTLKDEVQALPWALHAWAAEIQSCCWRSISEWFSSLPSALMAHIAKVIICGICFWAFSLHICN